MSKTRNRKRRYHGSGNHQNAQMVNIRLPDGSIQKKKYSDLIQHEKDIIENNMAYGYVHGYTEEEIFDYEVKAREQLQALRKAITDNPDVILKIYRREKRYYPEEEVTTKERADQARLNILK